MMGGAAAEDTSVLGVRRRASDHFTTSAPSAGRGLHQVINDFLVGVVHWRQTTLADRLMSRISADFHMFHKIRLKAQLLHWSLLQVSLQQMRERQNVLIFQLT